MAAAHDAVAPVGPHVEAALALANVWLDARRDFADLPGISAGIAELTLPPPLLHACLHMLSVAAASCCVPRVRCVSVCQQRYEKANVYPGALS